MSKRKDPKVVEVHWMDHNSDSGWKREADVVESNRQALVCRSIGWVVCEDKKHLTLAMNLSGSSSANLCGELMNIVKSCIVKRRAVRRSAR